MNQVLKECHFMRQRRKFQQDRDREHASFLASLQTETNRYVESTQIDFLIEKMIDVGEEEEEDL
jgi:hypothetical protein